MGIQHLLRGAGRVHKTAAGVFGGNELDPTGAQCVSFALAQKGSPSRHYLLLGTSHPPPGARLCVQLPFSCPQGFLLFSLLPCPLSHGSCRRKPGASNESQRAERAREGSCELICQRSTEETETATTSSCPPASTGAAELQPCIPLSKATPYSRQSPNTSARRHSPKEGLTATCTPALGKAARAFPAQPLPNRKIPLRVSSAQQEEEPATHGRLEHELPGSRSTLAPGRRLPRAARSGTRLYRTRAAPLPAGDTTSFERFAVSTRRQPSAARVPSPVQRGLLACSAHSSAGPARSCGTPGTRSHSHSTKPTAGTGRSPGLQPSRAQSDTGCRAWQRPSAPAEPVPAGATSRAQPPGAGSHRTKGHGDTGRAHRRCCGTRQRWLSSAEAVPDRDTKSSCGVFHWQTSVWEGCQNVDIYRVSHASDFSKNPLNSVTS